MTMQPTVHFLNVGWGDAHLIRMPSGLVTLIDGGDGRLGQDRDHTLDWMDREGVDTLDWMILTHIHEDHLNGLIDIAGSRKVVHAVLPYMLPALPDVFLDGMPQAGVAADDPSMLPLRVRHMLGSYLRLIRLLTEQGTDIRWRSDFASAESQVLWEEDEYELSHLYPWQGDPQPGLELLCRISGKPDCPEAERFAAYNAFFSASNEDSSVFRLARKGTSAPEGSVLFGGDQLEAGWETISYRAELKSQVWKVPHHGMEDGFSRRALSLVNPEVCVIPISLERSQPLRAHWESLRAGTRAASPFHLTGEVAPGQRVRLLDGPVEVWIGG